MLQSTTGVMDLSQPSALGPAFGRMPSVPRPRRHGTPSIEAEAVMYVSVASFVMCCCLAGLACFLFFVKACLCCLAQHARAGAPRPRGRGTPSIKAESLHVHIMCLLLPLWCVVLLAWLASCFSLRIACVVARRAAPARARRAK